MTIKHKVTNNVANLQSRGVKTCQKARVSLARRFFEIFWAFVQIVDSVGICEVEEGDTVMEKIKEFAQLKRFSEVIIEILKTFMGMFSGVDVEQEVEDMNEPKSEKKVEMQSSEKADTPEEVWVVWAEKFRGMEKRAEMMILMRIVKKIFCHKWELWMMRFINGLYCGLMLRRMGWQGMAGLFTYETSKQIVVRMVYSLIWNYAMVGLRQLIRYGIKKSVKKIRERHGVLSEKEKQE